jgi:glutathione S-transferase/maleylpyruvate isomerase
VVIHQLPLSLYSFKLRLALRLKGAVLPLLDPPGGSYRSAEYRAINPAGTIPALVGPQGLLAETDAIIEYLDDLPLGEPLRPADAWLAARHRMLSRWCDLRLEANVRSLFPQVAAGTRDAAAVAAADSAIAKALALIEGQLDGNGPFALGSRPGLADCGLAATLAWLAPLGAVLDLAAAPGPRLLRATGAMAAHPAIAAESETYAGLVAGWIAARARGVALRGAGTRSPGL